VKKSGRFFEKKLRKKLLPVAGLGEVLVSWGVAAQCRPNHVMPAQAEPHPTPARSKSFWGAFFQKGAF